MDAASGWKICVGTERTLTSKDKSRQRPEGFAKGTHISSVWDEKSNKRTEGHELYILRQF